MRYDATVSRGVKTGRLLTMETLERDFPGTKARRMTLAQLEAHEGHIEYWDGDSELAAEVREPTSGAHNTPVESLAALAALISAVRGAPIRTFGHVGLVARDNSGVMRQAMAPDQTVYLHPAEALMPVDGLFTVGEHDYPDVTLEVDHTTDARRRKLGLYGEWGFPEVWIDVPDARSPSRPGSRLPGLSIHVLRDGAYQQVSASRAFLGWKADSIHRALNEPVRSPETVADVTRVAAAFGAREGTGPDDDLLLGEQRRQAHEAGEREGWANVVGTMLAERGIETPPTLGTDLARWANLDRAGVVRAALVCRDIDDFLERLGRPVGTC